MILIYSVPLRLLQVVAFQHRNSIRLETENPLEKLDKLPMVMMLTEVALKSLSHPIPTPNTLRSKRLKQHSSSYCVVTMLTPTGRGNRQCDRLSRIHNTGHSKIQRTERRRLRSMLSRCGYRRKIVQRRGLKSSVKISLLC